MSLNYTLKIGDYNIEAFHVGELNVVKIYKGDVLIYEKLEPGPIEDLDEMVRLAIASKDIQRCQEVGAYAEEQTRGTSDTKYRYAAAKNLRELVDVNPSDILFDNGIYKATLGPLSQEVVDVNLMSLEDCASGVDTGGGDGIGFFSNCITFNSPLPSLTYPGTIFNNGPLVTFKSDLPNVTYGYGMFSNCKKLEFFSSNMQNLTDGNDMFKNTPSLHFVEPKNVRNVEVLDSIILSLDDCNMSLNDHAYQFTYFDDYGMESYLEPYHLSISSQALVYKGWRCIYNIVYGTSLFQNDVVFAEWMIDMPYLTYGSWMFKNSKNLYLYFGDLSSLVHGYEMFEGCTWLSHFSSNLSSLTNGTSMFTGCLLDAESVINIANTLNRNVTNSPRIDIGVNGRELTNNEKVALNDIVNKWNVYIDGVLYQQ